MTGKDMTEEERRILSRQLDRIERILIRCEEADKAERNKQRALRRQKKREEEGRKPPDAPDDETTH